MQNMLPPYGSHVSVAFRARHKPVLPPLCVARSPCDIPPLTQPLQHFPRELVLTAVSYATFLNSASA
jgi:hypothetical protein